MSKYTIEIIWRPEGWRWDVKTTGRRGWAFTHWGAIRKAKRACRKHERMKKSQFQRFEYDPDHGLFIEHVGTPKEYLPEI